MVHVRRGVEIVVKKGEEYEYIACFNQPQVGGCIRSMAQVISKVIRAPKLHENMEEC